MMPALFVMMLLLVVTGLSMPGSLAGVRQFLLPDFSHLTGQGVLDALGLAFFSLSIGLGSTTYGAYLPNSDGALRSGVWVVTLASLISVLAGLIFPVLASTGIDPTAGPGLTFMTMPAVFHHLPFGQVLAVVFFLLLLVAALSSSISPCWSIWCALPPRWGWSRRSACRVLTLLIMACGIPVSLSFGPWAEYTLFGKTLFDLLDYLTSNPDDAPVRPGADPAAGMAARRQHGAGGSLAADAPLPALVLAAGGATADRGDPGAGPVLTSCRGGWAALDG